MIGNIKLNEIDIDNNLDLIEYINKKNDDLQLEFILTHEQLLELIIYYIKENIEYLKDIDKYECIYPQILKQSNEFIFILNESEIQDENDLTDINFIIKELKHHFGANLSKCKLNNILRLILMDCVSYDIIDNWIQINIYYENYKHSVIYNYFNSLKLKSL